MFKHWFGRKERLLEMQHRHEMELARVQADANAALLATIRALGDNQKDTLLTLSEMVGSLAEGQQKSAAVLQTWLDGFKVFEQPKATTMTEEDEEDLWERNAYERELRREEFELSKQGLPSEFALAFALKD